ncbi:hypothetical protein GWR56_07855 [Mucilaginibacter sp. 14171R-50]|uniref:hypothetical protein n=1 Tax=Mucilaginibacter sp. 14171R-50 TaxID=2703789 RepID=UPI00138D1B9A|nr:hypothetical protein [Mucilaginibacter sp. 14171R-50]QHS55457.1 hypothetical protein GWR56_07855 [Mucilaginibacter sp. 14171R-50]
MIDFNSIWIDIECPQCKYIDEIQLIDAKAEKLRFCNNCKVKIQLKDSDGSVHSNIETINNAFKGLEEIFKKIGK